MSTYTYPRHRDQHWQANRPTDCPWCHQETRVPVCHCIRNEHDPRQVLVPDPTCPGCHHRHAAREARATATALGWLLLWAGALLLAAAGIVAASLWPGTPWSALGALPGTGLLALALYRALFGRTTR